MFCKNKKLLGLKNTQKKDNMYTFNLEIGLLKCFSRIE